MAVTNPLALNAFTNTNSAAATPTQLASGNPSFASVMLQADPRNSVALLVGNSGSVVYYMAPNDKVNLEDLNLSDVWFVTVTDGTSVRLNALAQ